MLTTSSTSLLRQVCGRPGGPISTSSRNNVLATQRLLEAANEVPLKKFVYASSSSVYGDAETFPTPEGMAPRPISPYGVTKLADEHLCLLYWRNYGVPVVCLRYFTVYGPRQRPDMAFRRFIQALLEWGAEVIAHDPHVREREWQLAWGEEEPVPLVAELEAALEGADCAVVVARHRSQAQIL